MGDLGGRLKAWTARSAMAGAALLAMAATAHADEAGCKALSGRPIAAAEIGLPTSGAKVTSAALVAAQPGTPAYCKILGAIAPVDRTAPPILFQLNLPEAWNKKAVQMGGGGLNGTVVNGLGRPNDSPPDSPLPLALGYATFGSDSGHGQGKPDMGVFAWNAEALDNYLKGAIKKTRDTAVALAAAYYGEAPRRVYYFGRSQGGREAMNAAQNFPADYDGIVAIVPVIGWSGLESHAYTQWEGAYANDWAGRPKPVHLKLIKDAILAACDGADGLKDGVVSNYLACKGPDLATLRCRDGKAADDCLTTPQLALVRRVHAPLKYGFTAANGATEYPGWPWGAGETLVEGPAPWMAVKGEVDNTKFLDQSRGNIGVAFARYFLVRDPGFSKPLVLKDYEAAFKYVSARADMTNPDRSAFAARGGKLLMKENWADYSQNPVRGLNYYKAVVAKMGQPKVDGFMRLYVNPGVDHGGSGEMGDGTPAPEKVDWLGALDAWVEKGEAPPPLTVTAYQGNKPGAARPLCRYPLHPHYDGKGDPNLAASFACKP